MLTTFHAELQASGNTKRIGNEIGYAGRLERLERVIEVSAMSSDGTYKSTSTRDEADMNGRPPGHESGFCFSGRGGSRGGPGGFEALLEGLE